MGKLTKIKSVINSMHISVHDKYHIILTTCSVRPMDESKVTKSANHIHSVIISMVMNPKYTDRLMWCKIRCNGIQMRDNLVQTPSTSIPIFPFLWKILSKTQETKTPYPALLPELLTTTSQNEASSVYRFQVRCLINCRCTKSIIKSYA
jgi:hypothetical protein